MNLLHNITDTSNTFSHNFINSLFHVYMTYFPVLKRLANQSSNYRYRKLRLMVTKVHSRSLVHAKNCHNFLISGPISRIQLPLDFYLCEGSNDAF